MRREIELDCGATVTVQAFHCLETYTGTIGGVPSYEVNARHLNAARREVSSLWETKVHLVRPDLIKRPGSDHPMLPRILVAALLMSSEPVTPNGDGSQLAVAWFRDSVSDATLHEIIVDGVRGVEWHEFAEDWDV